MLLWFKEPYQMSCDFTLFYRMRPLLHYNACMWWEFSAVIVFLTLTLGLNINTQAYSNVGITHKMLGSLDPGTLLMNYKKEAVVLGGSRGLSACFIILHLYFAASAHLDFVFLFLGLQWPPCATWTSAGFPWTHKRARSKLRAVSRLVLRYPHTHLKLL